MPRTRCLLATLLVSIGLIAALLAACGGGGSKPSASKLLDAATRRGTYGVGVTTIHLVDGSRPTAANRDAPASPERTLPIEVWYPAAASAAQPESRNVAPDRKDAPYPLIVFAHGLGGNRRQSAEYAQHLASHGYIVVSPDFPLSNLAAAGGARLDAVLEQPKDVSFVIDSVLQFSTQSGHLLNGAIDREKIGLTGHSLGALTTMLTIYGPDRDDRVIAALPFSTPGCFLGEGFAGKVSVPIMAVGGTNDLITPPGSADRAYAIANAPRYLVHIEGGDHVRFADVNLTDGQLMSMGGLPSLFGEQLVADALEVAGKLGGNAGGCVASDQADDAPITGERQREIMRTIAVPFFDAYLRGDRASRDFLQKLPDLVPEVRLRADLG